MENDRDLVEILKRNIIIHYFNAGGSTNFYETQIGSFLTENGWFWVKKNQA
jgi:hypothetical protein